MTNDLTASGRPYWSSGIQTGFIEQAGAICLRHRKGRAEVLLINGRRTGRWGIPKGGVELGESSCEAAVREAFEEAGVVGICREPSLGSFSYQKRGKPLPCRVAVHLIEVSNLENAFPEVHVRTPRWFDADNAADIVDQAELREMLRSLVVR